jgi:fucose 4-O-acetylase-like acetyltransferase
LFFAMQRRTDIDRAKGLAILLVVYGHLVARADPAGVHWYEPLRRAVYAFHMPFFLYLSGMAAVYAGLLRLRPTDWPQFAAARARRLLLPFLAVGALTVAGKCLAARIMFVDNPPAGFFSGLADLVWDTQASPALSIWYLFVLFVVSIAAPVFGGRIFLFLSAGLLLYFSPLPGFLYLDHIGRYAVFFALGVSAAAAARKWTWFVDRYWRWLAVIFTVALAIIAVFGASWPPAAELLPVGALSMPVLHGLVRNSRLCSGPVFLWLGRYSFMIYLFNTWFIGLAKGLLLLLLAASWDGDKFLPAAMMMMLAGTLGPVALKRLVFRRNKILDRFTN